MTIIFRNDSILPLECIKTFGVSAKENEHPIGYFGTGLKYAIAVLLREDCQINIIIEGIKYAFEKRKGEIRGKEFEFIYMNGEQLPFTTELGKNWALWQAYRELYSNCMDEKGMVTDDGVFRGGDTNIVVEGLDEIHAVRGEFILESKPLYELDMLEIHESENPGIFYKGIRVLTLPTRFSYNILSDLLLTEDRTASQWEVEYTITRAISMTHNIDAIAAVLTIDPESAFHEPKLNYSKYVTPSEAFMKLVSGLKKKPHNATAYYGHHAPDYVGGLPKEALSTRIRNKLLKIQKLITFKPKEVYVTKLDGSDYKIVNNELCLNANLMNKNDKKLTFVYLFACHKMSGKKDRSDYQVITEDMLQYFDTPKWRGPV